MVFELIAEVKKSPPSEVDAELDRKVVSTIVIIEFEAEFGM
jgi:hypothetical protein